VAIIAIDRVLFQRSSIYLSIRRFVLDRGRLLPDTAYRCLFLDSLTTIPLIMCLPLDLPSAVSMCFRHQRTPSSSHLAPDTEVIVDGIMLGTLF
jgi:hypothetical protein